MKKTLYLILLSSLISYPSSILSATYTLVGERHLRKYTAHAPSQVYNAETDAQQIVNNLCFVDWVRSIEKNATSTSHTESQLDKNVDNREKFDAAIFCAQHTNGTHVAYANAAVYRYRLPDGTLPLMTSLSAYVSSDPYNTLGARIVIMTNSTGEIPTDCATCRGDVSGGIKASGVAPRITRTVSGKNYWYPSSSNVVFSSSNGLSTGLQLQKYLFVFVLMENYATSRGNWIEGCSYLANSIRITTSAAVQGWTDGSTVDLSNFSEDDDEIDVTEAENIPWHGKMAAYDRKMTVVKLLDANGNASYFGAPENAFRLLHRNDTNLTALTHVVFRYGSSWGLGPNTNLTQTSFSPSSRPVKVRSVYADKSVTVMHGAVRQERGYEVNPPTRDMTDTDRGLIGSYASAFGVSADSSEALAASTSIPVGWLLYSGATTYADTDGDGLDIVHEWNNGNSPTDPFNPDTDGDTIVDGYALLYHLNGSDGNKDFDGDGLSNYAEYLISNVFAFADTNPDRYSTGGNVCDYFKKKGELYLGEIFTDHDQVDDEWESLYPSSCNPYVYDPDRDDDGDGWSNYAEYRAGTDPTRITKDDGSPEYPIPLVSLTLFGKPKPNRNHVVRINAWNENDDYEMTGIPDASWTATNTDGTVSFVLRESDPMSESCGGRLKEGKTSFVAFEDVDENGKYTPGEPFGVVRDVDVGWAGAACEIHLTKTDAITPRIKLTDGTGDRVATINEATDRFQLDDPLYRAIYGTNAEEMVRIDTLFSNRVGSVAMPAGKTARIRVVRYGIDNMFCYVAGVGSSTNYLDKLVMLDKNFEAAGRDYLCEADFLDEDAFDIDWNTLSGTDFRTGAVVSSSGTPLGTSDEGPKAAGLVVSNMTYLVVVGSGAKDFNDSSDSNTVVSALTTMITRRFEVVRHAPVAETVTPIQHMARPTFRWSIPDEEPWAKEYGCSYTAFKLQILAENGTTVVYDSGVRRAPAQDADGTFVWTAPVSAGDLTAQAKIFGKVGNWKWRVAMYNAKFKPQAKSILEKWSNLASFSTAVGTQQETDDNGYSSVNACVKYTGPVAVLNGCEDTSTAKGIVRLQAFTSPDFCGEPAAQGFIADRAALTDVTDVTANGTLSGLASGTYYLRAYIDSNGNLERDDWESWGAAKEAVTLVFGQKAQLVGLYIEDCDTDQDLFADSYEYVSYGSLTNIISNVKNNSQTILTSNMLSNASTTMSSISTGISGATLTLFENSTTNATHLLGWGMSNGNITFDDIRNAVQSNIVERINQ